MSRFPCASQLRQREFKREGQAIKPRKRSASVDIYFSKLKVESIKKKMVVCVWGGGGEEIAGGGSERGMSRRSLESSEQGRREGKRGLQKGGASVTLGVI